MEMEVMERPKGLSEKQRKESVRNTPKELFSNRMRIAEGSEDPTNIEEEFVSFMRHFGFTKENVITIFDGEERVRKFVQGLEGID